MLSGSKTPPLPNLSQLKLKELVSHMEAVPDPKRLRVRFRFSTPLSILVSSRLWGLKSNKILGHHTIRDTAKGFIFAYAPSTKHKYAVLSNPAKRIMRWARSYVAQLAESGKSRVSFVDDPGRVVAVIVEGDLSG